MCGRTVVILADGAQKIIPKFGQFCTKHGTSFQLITKAYAASGRAATAAAAAGQRPFMVSAASMPTLSKSGHRFEVSTKPGGYTSACTSEKVAFSNSL